MSKPRHGRESAGWWSWFQRSHVATASSRPSPATTTTRDENETPDHRTHRKGVFFPFLSDVDNSSSSSINSTSSRTAQQQEIATSTVVVSGTRQTPRSRKPTKENSGGSIIIGEDGQGGRRASRRKGVKVAEEKHLKQNLPLLWAFLREEKGWRFANDSSWDVCGPEVDGNSVPSDGPIPQGQVSSGLDWFVFCFCFLVLVVPWVRFLCFRHDMSHTNTVCWLRVGFQIQPHRYYTMIRLYKVELLLI